MEVLQRIDLATYPSGVLCLFLLASAVGWLCVGIPAPSRGLEGPKVVDSGDVNQDQHCESLRTAGTWPPARTVHDTGCRSPFLSIELHPRPTRLLAGRVLKMPLWVATPALGVGSPSFWVSARPAALCWARKSHCKRDRLSCARSTGGCLPHERTGTGCSTQVFIG